MQSTLHTFDALMTVTQSTWNALQTAEEISRLYSRQVVRFVTCLIGAVVAALTSRKAVRFYKGVGTVIKHAALGLYVAGCIVVALMLLFWQSQAKRQRLDQPTAIAAVELAAVVAAPTPVLQILPNPLELPVAPVESATVAEIPTVAASVLLLPTPVVEVLPDPWELPVEPVATTPVVAVASATAPLLLLTATNWADFDPYQLRKECQKYGIKWRHACSDGKHLSKKQMVTALQAI